MSTSIRTLPPKRSLQPDLLLWPGLISVVTHRGRHVATPRTDVSDRFTPNLALPSPTERPEAGSAGAMSGTIRWFDGDETRVKQVKRRLEAAVMTVDAVAVQSVDP